MHITKHVTMNGGDDGEVKSRFWNRHVRKHSLCQQYTLCKYM